LLITESHLKIEFPNYTGPVLHLDRMAEELAAQPQGAPPCPSLGDDLAYVSYTSGSTGLPKATAVEHRSVVNLVEGRAKIYGPEQFSATLASSSISFDSTISELYVALTTGGTVVLVDTLLELIDAPPAMPIRMLETVPSVLRELLRHRALPETVRTVCLTGERLPADLVDELYASATVELVYNTYGPTETTVSAIRGLIPPGSPRPPIGRTQPGMRAYILDERLRPVPPGMRGELFLGGVGVARGYLGRPELTRERFLPDPFVPIDSARMYRTGDVVREAADGQMEWLGRKDRQIKINGQRIELGEIEHALLRLPQVKDAAAVLHGTGGQPRLVAYLVAAQPLAWGPIRSALHRRLPGHMVPAEFVQLDRMPLNASNKLDLAALQARPTAEIEGAPETSALEAAVLGLWRQVLDDATLNVTDDFFAAGGHSLLALELARRLTDELGRPVTVRQLFTAPTVRLLTAALAESAQDS
jgi:amino acid adenylation domain-containing protein